MTLPLPLFGVVADLHEAEVGLLRSAAPRVVLGHLGAAIQIEEPLEPLDELQVVLVFALRQLLDLDVLLDVALLERLLQNLEVLDELPLVLGPPVDLRDLDLAWEHRVEHLAVHCARPQLLDSAHVQLQQSIHPVQQIALWHEEGALHHPYALVCHLNIINPNTPF